MTLNVDIAWFVCSISAMTTMTIATDAAAATTIIKIKITGDAKKETSYLFYSNAFLSCYNASSPCFCTTLCQLICRTYCDILILALLVFNPGDLYYLGYKIIKIIIINHRDHLS